MIVGKYHWIVFTTCESIVCTVEIARSRNLIDTFLEFAERTLNGIIALQHSSHECDECVESTFTTLTSFNDMLANEQIFNWFTSYFTWD